jgi:hypothetical protein
MPVLAQKKLIDYRKTTFRLSSQARLKSPEQALRYINERGFIFFWPAKGITLPSLWSATAGDRPVADEHDDPGHITWGWKDGLLGSGHCYYAKLLRRRGTFLSNNFTPYFYALSENYGSPEEDYLIQYQEGRLTQESRQVYETLLDQGPLNTIVLRKKAHLTSREGDTRFNKALDQLMADFKILPIGITEAGAWHYSYMYDTVSHYDPGLSERARPISQKDARVEILKSYFLSVGAAQSRDIQRLFQWQPDQIVAGLSSLTTSSLICPDIEVAGQSGSYFVLRQLV